MSGPPMTPRECPARTSFWPPVWPIPWARTILAGIFSHGSWRGGEYVPYCPGVVLIGGIIGTVIGCLTGYFGGAADLVLMRVCDAITAFPSILLALVLINVFGMGKYQIILILGILFIPSFARVVRGRWPGAESELCGLGPAHGGQPPADYLPAYPPQHGAGAAAHCGHRL
ncbi:MAG: ABC transporter permease subunit [Evtepia gabavorous]